MNRLINKVIAVVSAASVALTGVNFGALDLSAWAENLEDVTITLSDGNGELFSAADSADENSGECGESAIWEYDADHGILTVSGTGAISDYSNPTNAPWYSLRNDITQIVIGEGITGVGKLAFSCCSAVECLSLPSTLTTFGTWAFNGCDALRHINIPSGTTYADYAGKGSLPSDSLIYISAFNGSECSVCLAERLIDDIGSLSDVTSDSRSIIELARSAFNSVPSAYRSLVRNYSTLSGAEVIAYYIPQNIAAAVSGYDVTVTWNAVEGAAKYKVVDSKTGDVIEETTSGDIDKCTFYGEVSRTYELVVYAYVDGEWGRPSGSVTVIVEKKQMPVMGSGIITNSNGYGESRLEAGTYNTPLYFDNTTTIIGYSIGSDLTCTGSLKVNGSELDSSGSLTSPVTWTIGGDFEPNNSEWNFMNVGNRPYTVIVGGDMYLNTIATIRDNFEVYVAGDVYIDRGLQLSGKLWVAGDIYLLNYDPYLSYYYDVNSDDLFVGGNITDVTNNAEASEYFTFKGNFSVLDKTSAEWINAEETLKERTSSPEYMPLKVFEENDTPDHVSLRFNIGNVGYFENDISVPEYTCVNYELNINNHPNGVVVDEIIDYGNIPYGDPYGFIIDTGNDPQNVFRIQVQPNIDSDGDGTKDTFSWTPCRVVYGENYADSPYILVKGRGTVIIDVPDGVTYQTANKETVMHINWYTMLGGKYGTGYHNEDSLDQIILAVPNSIITEGWVHTADICNGVCDPINEYDENGNGYWFCGTHQRKVNTSEMINGCACNGVVDTAAIDSWLAQNSGSLTQKELDCFYDEDGSVIYPGFNIIINASGENSRINPVSTRENALCGWIYSPTAPCSTQDTDAVYVRFILGGIIASELTIDKSSTYYYCRPDDSVINMIKNCTKTKTPAVMVANEFTYKDGTGLVFQMDLTADILNDTSARMVFTLGGKTIEVPVADAATTKYKGKQVYAFTCPVAAAEMADDIQAKIVTDTYESEIFTNSVQQCVSDAYSGFYETEPEYSEIMEYFAIAAMLNYGTAAQNYFSHNANDPANSVLEDCDKDVPDISEDDLLIYKAEIVDESKSGIFKGMQITLNELVTLKLYFNGSTLTAEDFTVTNEDGSVAPARFSVTNDGGITILAIKDIAPGDFGKSFAVTVGNSTISNISVLSYAEQALSRGITELYGIAAAMVNYNSCVVEAKQYDT